MKEDLKDFKNFAVDFFFKSGLIILVISKITLIIRDYPNIFTFKHIVEHSFLLLLAIFVILRNKIPLTLKIGFSIWPLFLIMILGLGDRGLLSASKVYIIAVPVIASFLISYKRSVVLLILFISTYLIIGFLLSYGYIHDKIPIVGINYSTWIAEAVIIFLSAFLLLYIGKNYNEKINRTLSQLKLTNDELSKHKENLEQIVKERTTDLISANDELNIKNDKLFEKNEIINLQNTELKDTLLHLKETQSQLIQVEKMASLGTLTSGVAHEINNPLNYLMGAKLGLDNYFKMYGTMDEERTEVFLNSINIGIERISSIVQGLNQFSSNNDDFDEKCNIHAILDNCLIMLNYQTKYKAKIKKEYTQEQILIKGNVGKLYQVFLNILTNSIQAITENGFIIIKTSIDNIDAIIEIIDDGIGIEKEHLPKITDPFFTTKPPGEGVGLGLSIAYSIIKDHKGKIEFESEVNKGTKAIVSLTIIKE